MIDCLDDLRLAQRYAESKLYLLVNFVVGRTDEKFVACFQRKQLVGGSKVKVQDRDDSGLGRGIGMILSDHFHKVPPEVLHLGSGKRPC